MPRTSRYLLTLFVLFSSVVYTANEQKGNQAQGKPGTGQVDERIAENYRRSLTGEAVTKNELGVFDESPSEPHFFRAQGDSISNPFVIDSLPFHVEASTVGFTHDYNEACTATTAGAPDVVYELTLDADLEYPLIIDLCESYYDTKVYVYADGNTSDPVACSDDDCTASHGQLWTSYLEIHPDSIPAGTYHIIVDGYGSSSSGDYVLDVYENIPPNYPIYTALGSAIDFAGNVLGSTTTGSVLITNTGGANLELSAIAVSGTGFSTAVTSLSIATGDTAAIDVSFAPTAEQDYTGMLTFSTNDSTMLTDTIALSGYGVDAVFFEGFDPPTGSYTDLPMVGWTIVDGNGDATSIPEYQRTWYHDEEGVDGSGNMAAYIGFSNSYSASEQLTTPSFTVTEPSGVYMDVYSAFNPHPLNVIQVNSDGTKDTLGTITPGTSYDNYTIVLNGTGTMQIEFDFSPPAGGSFAYLNLDNVKVAALPPDPVYTASGSTIDFAGNVLGSTTTGSVLITNTGGGTLDISAVAVSGTGFSTTFISLSIAAGYTLSLDVSFAPTVAQDYTGMLTFSTNDTTMPTDTIALSGYGVDAVFFEGFDADMMPPTGWTETHTGSNGWQSNDADADGSGRCAYHNDDSGDQDSWLITPELDLSSAMAPRLIWWNRIDFSLYINGVHDVSVSTDGGTTWTVVDSGIPLPGEVDGNWYERMVDVSTYAGSSSVMIGFHYTGNYADEWYIDDMSVAEPPTDPIYMASGSTIDFAGNVLGSTTTGSVLITNTGGDTLDISAVTVSGTGFSTAVTSLDIVTGDTAALDVSFAPTAAQDYTGMLIFATNDSTMLTDTIALSGYGVDAVFFEDFDPHTGSYTDLPMADWTIVDGNGDATSIPEYQRTWYHDDFGVDGSGNMVAYIGSSNSYSASEQLTTPSFTVTEPTGVSMDVYSAFNSQPLNVVQVNSDGTKDTLGTITPGTSYDNYTIVLNGTGPMQIEFDFSPASGGSFAYLNLDNIRTYTLPNTYVSGTVTDNETDLAINGATIEFSGVTGVTDANGAFGLYGANPGQHVLAVSAAGYLDAHFTLVIEEGDSLEQNVDLFPIGSVSSTVYETSFEIDDDLGWTFTGGTNPFEVSNGFTFVQGSDSVDVAPYSGSSMMVCSPTGYVNNEFSWWFNLPDSDMDLSSVVSADITLKMNYWTENNYDDIILLANRPEIDSTTYYYLDVNGDGVGDGADVINGVSDGWVEVTADLTPFVGTSYGVEIAVLFDADGSVISGFGVAIDDISVTGYLESRPGVQDLMAESFVNDQIALSWSEPSGGERIMETNTISMNRTERARIDPRNPRKAYDYETGTAALTINIPDNASRDLVGYNVYRTDQNLLNGFEVGDFSGFELIANTMSLSYVDTDVDNFILYYYYVTAVYDEGESIASYWAAAGAGLVNDVTMAELAVDFEDITYGNWDVVTFVDNGWGIGDSASASSSLSPIPDNGGYFAYINDDAAGSGVSSQSRLMTPFFNLGDADHATLMFDYFNDSGNQTLELWAWIGWDTWLNLGSLPENNDWQTVSVDLSNLAGVEHVRLYFWYDDVGAWAYSVAVDNIAVATLPGPTNLTGTATLEDVTLSWTGIGGGTASRVNEYPHPVEPWEKELSQERKQGIDQRKALGVQVESPPEPHFVRVQGDSISNPFVIGSLPFYEEGSTVGFTDDYNEVCPYSPTGAPDVVYELTLTEDLEYPLIVDLCQSYYDTKVYVYANGDINDLVACNDDFCTADHGQLYTSYLEIHPDSIPAGTYHIIVDGYDNSSSGDYVLDVYEAVPPPPIPDVLYNVYRDDMLLASALESTHFVDETATLDSACYVVTASLRRLGTGGDTVYVETGASNEACGALFNAPPGDFTLLSPTDGDTVTITEDNLNTNQRFEWSESADPNGTPVEYEICVTWEAPPPLIPIEIFCEGTGADTFYDQPLTEVVAFIDSLNALGLGVVHTFGWQVFASDGVNETFATGGPYMITFDAGYVLGVEDELGVPDEFTLHQNYPNPFNPVTTIRFDVPEESHIRLMIYNVLGQQVATPVNGTMKPGYKSIRWNGTDQFGKPLPSGMYIYQIQSASFNAVKKLVLMK